MVKKFLSSKELEEELNLSGYDIYQYARRGLPVVQKHPTLYDLEEVKEWLAGYAKREEKRILLKEEIIRSLSEEEREIVTEPKSDAGYGVIWENTDKRRRIAVQRLVYLLVMHSTTNLGDVLYLSDEKEAAREVEEAIKEKIGKDGKGFKSCTFTELAKSILASKGLYLLYASDEQITNRAIQLLEEDTELLEKMNLKYRPIIVERLEKTKKSQRRLFELLSTHYNESMLNLSKKDFEQSKELRDWMERVEDLQIIKR